MNRNAALVFVVLLATAIGVSGQAPDRSKPPATGAAPALNLPAVQKRQLSNGLPVWIVEMHEVPVAQINLVILSGTADDPAGKYGIASLTAAMLAEGAGSRSSLEIADAIDFLGADMGAASGVDSVAIRLHVPVARLADALPIMADVALRPTFPADELERLRQQRLTGLHPGARRSVDDRRPRVRPRALRPHAPVRHGDDGHDRDDPVVHGG